MNVPKNSLLDNFNLKRDFYKFSLIGQMIIVFVIFQILTNGLFITNRNLSNLLMQGATCSIISVTMMLVLVSTNADLSAGTALGFMGTVAASLQVYLGIGTGWSIITVLLVGVLIGLWHGFWIAYKKLPAFIVTLASQLIFRGGTLLIGEGRTIGPVQQSFAVLGRGTLPSLFIQSDTFNDFSFIILIIAIIFYISISFVSRSHKMREGMDIPTMKMFLLKLLLISAIAFAISSPMVFYRGFPYAVLLLFIIALVFDFIVKNTSFGRHVFAIGGNRDAARLSGINIEFNLLVVYVLHSVVTAVAAIVFLGRVGQATASAGTGFEFTAITGCVVGGTSILGGRGNVIGAVIGTMLMAALDNGMSLLNLNAAYQFIVKGLVLLLAIALDVLSKSQKA